MSAKLTVVILTKDEEDKISRCIESVKWADEVLVIDDESMDRTREIAKGAGARVIVNKSNGNFDNQRNIGIDNASGEWILQMDADEVVTDKLGSKIVEAISSPEDFAAFQFRRKNYFLGHFMRYAEQYHYWLRLFRKENGRYIGADIHEKLKIDGKTGVIEADMEHFAFTSISQFIARQNHYSSFEAQAMFVREGALPEKVIRYNIKIKPLKIFWKNYIKKNGYKDGMHGLIWCVLLAFRHIMIWTKYWEIIKQK
ncbi:MAG: hypothetical protein COV72_03295 [Candidatus Omnitrophica bacterium CG11_big_fil_rev_8_21_14_0_20_42_13]|uniref:Glycosyltransferase 2-like domain-containing protein n=1 Tax=Candidatus Ghiorseimicrobium undicola TaxID=1974746 RepID=A0A2H0LY73_9BACT|nr:MAG: hypothetical protein COV72_03295 [Candidatus Omnitrophica bacterium CG11_big_fil_rev_8_21_14_0_20_42_13]